MSPETGQALATLLERRLEVIADHDWRDRDEKGHLAALIEVGGAIETWKTQHLAECGARLRHFLEGSSLDKALAWIREGKS